MKLITVQFRKPWDERFWTEFNSLTVLLILVLLHTQMLEFDSLVLHPYILILILIINISLYTCLHKLTDFQIFSDSSYFLISSYFPLWDSLWMSQTGWPCPTKLLKLEEHKRNVLLRKTELILIIITVVVVVVLPLLLVIRSLFFADTLTRKWIDYSCV
jgi:hypothetical protein